MTERPILMTAANVEAILDGTKTMTRRLPKSSAITKNYEKYPIVKQQELNPITGQYVQKFFSKDLEIPNDFGNIGDRLWVKEHHYAYGYWTDTERHDRPAKEFLTVNDKKNPVRYGDDVPDELLTGRDEKLGWYKRNSLFMHKRHSRITLEITNLKFQKLGDITKEDAIKEGVICNENHKGYRYPVVNPHLNHEQLKYYKNPIDAFVNLWELIHGDGSWKVARDFYVWGIEFKIIKP